MAADRDQGNCTVGSLDQREHEIVNTGLKKVPAPPAAGARAQALLFLFGSVQSTRTSTMKTTKIIKTTTTTAT